MLISININNIDREFEIKPNDTLLSVLRREGYFRAKFGGCTKGECGACAILLDGIIINACSIFAAQVDGHKVHTVEDLGEHPMQGWRQSVGLDILQQAFIETGAVQCGYCTPAMLMATHALLEKEKFPSENQIRDALSGILCRCTGYLKPVEAVLRAAAIIRGEYVPPIEKSGLSAPVEFSSDQRYPSDEPKDISSDFQLKTKIMPKVFTTSNTEKFSSVGKPEVKVDAVKLVQGKPAFTDDFEMRGMLTAKVLRSPIAHGRIKLIDTNKAKSLPGVVAVLTYKDLPRVIYSTAGQSDPMPGPLDAFSLDEKVRFVGDRVAFVAAETEDIANQAVKLIEVEYEEFPFIIDSRNAMVAGAVKIHDEPEFVNFDRSDPVKNIAAAIRIDIGNIEEGFAEADHIIETEYKVPKVHQAHIETHVAISYWDEDDRLVIRTSTQVPFHVRRILAPVLGLPMQRIRVIKPRIGGGFGSKQEILIEDVVAHLTIATKRPVRYEYTREEEFIAARSRHPMIIKVKTGVLNDGTITANEMYALSDTGAYGCHALTVTGNTGHKAMALYPGDGKYRKSPNIRFYADIVYTNTPPAGAYRGYGGPQGFWAIERHMETISSRLGLDPIQFRLKNCLRAGEIHPFSMAWSEGREPQPEYIQTIGLEKCVHQGKSAIGWDQKFGNDEWRDSTDKPYLKRGIGMALMMHGTAIPYLDMGSASIKMNEDGSFNLLIGATDLGTGSDTVLAQMAAEVLGARVEDFIVYSSDTDFTPFDKGAYASSTTYISGAATTNAANKVADRMRVRAAMIMNDRADGRPVDKDTISLKDRIAIAPDGRTVTFAEIGHHSLHHKDQEQIMAVASYVSPVSPPPFAAQFAEIVLDTETGQVKVEKLVMAVDAGTIVNPLTASGQIEGGMTQALGYAICEEMTYDSKGSPVERDLVDYHIFRADEMPDLETIFVETFEPSHPFGVKAVAEIPLDGVAPAVANAIYNASGAMLYEIPATPDRVWEALQSRDDE